ncbi:TonB-dependent siderophore receptor [Rhizobium sp. CFBP 8762]|uniref:TonB-dependent siderophore receptor n=1 Tax=Rhizobium sp. CFBP 8762 TaxID=2775279 RepID=UPI001780BD4C|nr:TonB-dependent siderophore receptor [Rhizobium sp. CFBP 8762]MBD8554995.1 TonB-dependent siderophore receptor [Rhizobium sp. CFBP 8762]
MNKQTSGAANKQRFHLSSVSTAVALTITTSLMAAGPSRSQQQVQQFSVPAGALDTALSRFGITSGVQVLYDAGVTRGRTSPGANGARSTEAAIRQILEGTGLSYYFTSPTSVTIASATAGETGAASSGGSSVLAPIVVQGQNAFGPVEGYLASSNSSATKTDTPLIETPQSVTVVTADQISNQKATSVADTLSYTPGVTTQSGTFSRIVDDFTIRGFNVANGNTGTLRDGMKFQSNVYDGGQEPYGLERVEVLRGASSVLYGQLAPGGVVNGVSKRPTDTELRELNVDYGSNNRKQISGDFGGPLTDDGVLTYRLTGLLRNADNWVDNTPDNKTYIAPALTWKPDEATSLTVLSSYQHIHTRFATPLLYPDVISGHIPRDAFLGIDSFDKYNIDMYSIGTIFEHEFDNGVKFSNSNRYFRSDLEWNYMMGNIAPLSSTGGRLARLGSARNESSYGVTSDSSLKYSFDALGAEHTVLGGFDYYRRSYDSHRFRGTAPSLLNLGTGTYTGSPAINYNVDRGADALGDQYGIYLQDQIKFDDHWVMLLGGRHDWADSSSKSYQTGVVTQQRDTALTGRVGLVYLFDNGFAPYLSASQSFLPQAGVDYVTKAALKPNEGVQYEAGLRYQPLGSNMLFSAAVYDLTQTNVVTYDSAGLSYQQGKVKSRGLELEARGEFGNLGLVAAYAYTDAKITESAKAAEIGEQVSLVPRHNVSLWADYALDDVGLEGVKIGGGVRYVGETNLTDNSSNVPGYVLVDAMASFDLGKFKNELDGATLKLNARNLFDKQFYTCVSSDGCRYGEPLTVAATLSYTW